MKKTKTNSKPAPIPVSQMRPEDQARERIPWKEMEVGGIYQRKDGRYFIYAGRAVVYHCNGTVTTRESDKHYYSYIYVDSPKVLSKALNEDILKIVSSTARIRSSEYRDIARTKVGQLNEFVAHSEWSIGEFLIKTEPNTVAVGSTRRKVVYSSKDKKSYDAFVKKADKTAKPKTKSKTKAKSK